MTNDSDSDIQDDDEEIGNVSHIFAGYADGTIKKWDVKQGNCVLHIEKQTKKEIKSQGPCYIWTLKKYKGYLISGDSKGEISIWDDNFGTLVKKFNQLQGDILTMEINPVFDCLYATGVDSRVVSIALSSSVDEDGTSGPEEWVLSSIYRGQSHDIKSLVMLGKNSLISGGITTDICFYKL